MTIPPIRAHSDPAADAAALLSRLGLALLGIVAPCAAIGARRAVFILMPIGCALILLAALLGANGEGFRQMRASLLTPIGLAIVFLSLWSAISLLWTPFRVDAGARFIKVAGTLILAGAASAFLPERTRANSLYIWPIGAGLAALGAIALEILHPPFLAQLQEGEDSTLERGLIACVVLVWPALAALALRHRWNSAAILAVVVAGAAVAVQSPPAIIAMLLGVLAFAACGAKPRGVAPWLAGLAAVLLLAAPAIPLALRMLPLTAAMDPTGAMAGFSASMATWAEIVRGDGWRLLTGHGLDSATRGISGHYLAENTPLGILFEIWYELGALGALASAWLVAQAFLVCGRLHAGLAPFALAGLVSLLTIAMLGQSTAQLWWVTVLGIVLVAFAHVARGQHLDRRPKVQAMRAFNASQT